MNKMMKMLAIGAIGYTGFCMYKKYNPDYKKDIKNSVNKMVDKVAKMNEDMMQKKTLGYQSFFIEKDMNL